MTCQHLRDANQTPQAPSHPGCWQDPKTWRDRDELTASLDHCWEECKWVCPLGRQHGVSSCRWAGVPQPSPSTPAHMLELLQDHHGSTTGDSQTQPLCPPSRGWLSRSPRTAQDAGRTCRSRRCTRHDARRVRRTHNRPGTPACHSSLQPAFPQGFCSGPVHGRVPWFQQKLTKSRGQRGPAVWQEPTTLGSLVHWGL